ncbi:MAG: protein-glutamate O-methyltransferase CheR [Bdellovibrionales bacterium]|nr:protein-glutamate O-methyltransferase CheR [Bdellovibrionales bacterium]
MTAESDEMDQSVLQRTLKLVRIHTGITMNETKRTLVQGRLRPRIRELGLADYSAYLDYLETHKEEIQSFINLVTTNETSFFRTTRVWDFLRKEFLPSWQAKKPTRALRIWSAASSTGEEPYTIGICCQDFRRLNPTFDYQILATDIDTNVLAIAECAEYAGRSIDAFRTQQSALFERYLTPSNDRYQVVNEVKNKIKFTTHNLFKTPSQRGHYDLVFLRNVLIYFGPEDQEKVLENIGLALNSEGLLVIGESESLNHIRTNFRFKAPLIYERTGI